MRQAKLTRSVLAGFCKKTTGKISQEIKVSNLDLGPRDLDDYCLSKFEVGIVGNENFDVGVNGSGFSGHSTLVGVTFS
ncbi:hypothetical protein PC129_g11114 [Phytophthora cactorum]|uniref:Uncharacterized protein n=1 Tax=Phytophthora cactorum TaxID=29920 RepID=A0A8T0YXT0_9STRA|nr:hypothetical protein PC112_g21565 [Phytophthora cactorum]KAG2813645.1 hypothetical protein PC111_g14302 [Phytophthora cactorum]KAG2854455.1 hypothetical protein PC113_g13282 [Phytophthora cactorum]KAG2877069.1 hypothetical protein PC114_g23851 [Phytophthora cactorum]KAG2889288.1 hypothetical protein PC117_g24724 [Phytophthora cactorum]